MIGVYYKFVYWYDNITSDNIFFREKEVQDTHTHVHAYICIYVCNYNVSMLKVMVIKREVETIDVNLGGEKMEQEERKILFHVISIGSFSSVFKDLQRTTCLCTTRCERVLMSHPQSKEGRTVQISCCRWMWKKSGDYYQYPYWWNVRQDQCSRWSAAISIVRMPMPDRHLVWRWLPLSHVPYPQGWNGDLLQLFPTPMKL